jgi:hypothetical protein
VPSGRSGSEEPLFRICFVVSDADPLEFEGRGRISPRERLDAARERAENDYHWTSWDLNSRDFRKFYSLLHEHHDILKNMIFKDNDIEGRVYCHGWVIFLRLSQSHSILISLLLMLRCCSSHFCVANLDSMSL